LLLYIHIPFCDSKCHYCAFNSYVDKSTLKNSYMQALAKQLEIEIKKKNIQKISSVFIGGGTPSSIQADLYEKIFTFISPYLQTNCEITIEANPNSASFDWLQEIYALGVNRVSFGVQSFNDKKLRFLGRAHSKHTAISALEDAHKIGFKNISLDLIYATKLDTPSLLKEDLKMAMSLPINHLSAYALIIEENTKFQNFQDYSKENVDETKEFFELIGSYGFEHYEISNFGKYKSLHNLGYWQTKEYLGIGAGAVGFSDKKRFYPHKSIEKYIKDPLFHTIEYLSAEDLHVEKIFLGLRSCIGLHVDIFSPKELEKISLLVKENKLYKKGDFYYNVDFLLADEIALYILGS
jgi:oxygen-independent coproporphyrinogen III oxidase